MSFYDFRQAVAEQFNKMRTMGQLFTTATEKDTIWETYLKSFPEGTNLVFRKRTEHDCSTCRSFIKAVGNVVAINSNNELVSIWDIEQVESHYMAVAQALADYVKSCPIDNIFLYTEKKAGIDKNFDELCGADMQIWHHFFINIPDENFCHQKRIGPRLSETKALHDVLLRSCKEITLDSIDTVLDLISQNSLYRGGENYAMVKEFREVKQRFMQIPQDAQDRFVWLKIGKVPASVAKIRNTAIGTLLVDLSNGVDLEKAVSSFEVIVAPTNYKRPTALVTKRMIEDAKERIEELGLTSALERRCATLSDININNIIFADRTKNISDNIFDDMIEQAGDKKPKEISKVQEISIDRFISDVVPNISSLEILFENKHKGNLVTLVAPANPTAGNIFKWNNNFSWAYNGNVTDSIKERVKRAGGVVNADVCCRLAWYNTDDLDLHMTEPDGTEIFYGHKKSYFTGGTLDVDMNVNGETCTPVENIFYANKSNMHPGKYILYVNNYRKRESEDVGFEVEVDILGETYNFAYDKAVRHDETILVAVIVCEKDGTITIIPKLPQTTISKNIWNISTETFRKVNTVMYSPNYWDNNNIGNKHYLFMLDGCRNEEPTRGFFNEFLREDLNVHRKVFEIVGSKMLALPVDNQLSGLGFSSTQHTDVLCKVSGSFNRMLEIKF